MKRVRVAPRPEWRERMTALGFDWHSLPAADGTPETYWDESAYWELTSKEVDVLETATEELHEMCLAATEHAIKHRLLPHFGFPPAFAALIEQSWTRRDEDQTSIYGRFDFAFTGGYDAKPKMLEYNADTPTGLYEASVVQWNWLEDAFPDADQFNSIHEGLVAAWAKLDPAATGVVHMSCLTSYPEDEGTLRYMLDTALEAGLSGKIVPASEIGWAATEYSGEGESGWFVDGDDVRIATLFKLIPWEWLLADRFGPSLSAAIARRELKVIEPAWRMVPANKAILAVLWELFPDHPYLLPAYFNRKAFAAGDTVVAKPLFGREGANISIATIGEQGEIKGAPLIAMDGEYGEDPYIYQLHAPLAASGGNSAVIGSWVIDGASRGIGIREDTGLVTHNRSRFVPHLFR